MTWPFILVQCGAKAGFGAGRGDDLPDRDDLLAACC
jgi:hypothetical protein